MRRSRRSILRLAAGVMGAGLGARLLAPGDASAASAPLAQGAPFLAGQRIVSFYGTPLAPGLGALGQGTPAQMLARLRAQADAYAALDPARPVVPALHLIYAVAQSEATGNGLFIRRAPDEVVWGLSDLARDNGMLLFLDNQLGTSTIARELAVMAPYLAEPHVHLALDPEFAWDHPGLVPGGGERGDIGFLTSAQVNEAQASLQAIATENGLPGKILIVHQFRHGMLPDKVRIAAYDGVELVIDMDGFGPPASKLETYGAVITADNVELPGIKLFYDHDVPLLTPEDVLALRPRPVVVIYQ
jgi:hypothetical protein